MAGLFIDVKVADDVANSVDVAKKLEEVCPVGIFRAGDAGVKIAQENLDECVLCDLCLEAAPAGGVEVLRLYES